MGRRSRDESWRSYFPSGFAASSSIRELVIRDRSACASSERHGRETNGTRLHIFTLVSGFTNTHTLLSTKASLRSNEPTRPPAHPLTQASLSLQVFFFFSGLGSTEPHDSLGMSRLLAHHGGQHDSERCDVERVRGRDRRGRDRGTARRVARARPRGRAARGRGGVRGRALLAELGRRGGRRRLLARVRLLAAAHGLRDRARERLDCMDTSITQVSQMIRITKSTSQSHQVRTGRHRRQVRRDVGRAREDRRAVDRVAVHLERRLGCRRVRRLEVLVLRVRVEHARRGVVVAVVRREVPDAVLASIRGLRQLWTLGTRKAWLASVYTATSQPINHAKDALLATVLGISVTNSKTLPPTIWAVISVSSFIHLA